MKIRRQMKIPRSVWSLARTHGYASTLAHDVIEAYAVGEEEAPRPPEPNDQLLQITIDEKVLAQAERRAAKEGVLLRDVVVRGMKNRLK